MEKENMIKVMVMGMAVLAIAAPILISTMTALTQGGNIERFTVQTEDTYDEETGELISTEPRRALDMVGYAKSEGADSWELTVYYGAYDYTLYKNGRIIEEVINSPSWGLYKETLWYIHSNGYGCTYPYSTSVYLYNEEISESSGMMKLTFTYSRGTTEIKGYDHGENQIYEQTVKLEKLWFVNIHGNYIVGPNNGAKFVDTDDIYIIHRVPNILIHGNDVEYNVNGTVYEGSVDYTYTESDDSPVKMLESVNVTVRWYDEDWRETELDLTGNIYGIITPAELTYREPYVNGTVSAILTVIPIIVLLGIGIYLFKRLSQSE